MLLKLVRRLLAGMTGLDFEQRTAGTHGTTTLRLSNGAEGSRSVVAASADAPIVAGQFEIVDLSDVRKTMRQAWPDLAGTALKLLSDVFILVIGEG